jgi:hypothetical protein
MKSLLIPVLLFFGLSSIFSQQLLMPTDMFSKKKPVYLTLQDGSEVEGTIKNISRKKGLIEEIEIKTTDGKKEGFKAEEIKHMYLAPSGLEQLAKFMDIVGDAQKWTDETLNQDKLNDGYVYFELVEVEIKKDKVEKLQMQLLNPAFSKKFKVYYDPFANESASVGIGGVTVAGGDAKSYFVTKGDGPAYKLKKKDYKDEFASLWGDCESLMNTYGDAIKWREFTKHIIAYSECE